jgi:ABC-type polysaccharide/polyol phosphate transport system ATPase subunit
VTADSGTRAPVVIEARDVAKSFQIPHERLTTFKERVLRPGTWLGGAGGRLEALRRISFDVHRGEFFGVIGRNGSGKSTLLKLLASIYRLDSGTLRIAGRMAPFIELGVGFNPELAARDNIVLNGVMMGLSPAEARSRFEAVIDYAELHDYTGMKLKNYSSGMHVRLAFALMLQADPGILVVDEVLAVGDASFQEKCIASMEDLKSRGTTIVLVTHDMSAVTSHCDRAMMIEDGVVEAIGDPALAAARYLELLTPFPTASGLIPTEAARRARYRDVWLSNRSGDTVEAIGQDEPVTLNLVIRANAEVPQTRLDVELINNPEGVTIDKFRIGYEGEIPPLADGDELTVRVTLEPGSLRPGVYRIHHVLAEPDRVLDASKSALPLRVLGPGASKGLVDLNPRISIETCSVRSAS